MERFCRSLASGGPKAGGGRAPFRPSAPEDLKHRPLAVGERPVHDSGCDRD
jgi:hypothetical protein